jgi:8-oxo-dGTP pyrophosphatase MutT (NUDIX family)
MELKDQIHKRLATLKPRLLNNGFTREAAVLLPLLKRNNEYRFLLTKRTEEVQTHKGQISFPGGMREKNEDLIKTALRETYEEVGIEEESIEILGRFHDYISITRYRVTPFAGFINGPFRIKPQIREVAEVLEIPIRIFLDPGRLRIKKNNYRNRGETEVYFYSYGPNEVWGLTARIIKDFLETLNLQP